MFNRELVNEFSWSKSRHGKLEECPRLYWLHYYGAWGGWEATVSPEVRETYVLKHLSTRQQWAGKVVHEAVAFSLSITRSGAVPPVDTLVQRIHLRMREEFRRSRRGDYRQHPKRVLGLVEHELGEPIADEEWKANWDNVERCVRSFYASDWMRIARTLPRGAWLPIDEIDSFLLDGVKVFAGPDFAYRDGETTVLVDWKTGRPRPEDEEQVQGYTLFAGAKWSAPPERVLARLVYLSTGEERAVTVTPAALETFRSHFRESVARMRSLMRDPARNFAVADDFPMTESMGRCRLCAFRRRCGRHPAAAPLAG